MRRNRIIVIATALLASLVAISLALAGGAPAGPTPSVAEAWVRLPAVAGNPGAGYFTIRGGDSATRIIDVTSPAAGRVELHGPDMRPLSDMRLPAGGTLAFEPGGAHAMLFDLEPDLAPGASVPLTIHFADGMTASTEAGVRAAGDSSL